MDGLEAFIVRAKAATYVGDGAPRPPCRIGAHDIRYEDGGWAYLDSYFGGTDFLGQEVVWQTGTPVWAMNYYGRILRPDRIRRGDRGPRDQTGPRCALPRRTLPWRVDVLGRAERLHRPISITSWPSNEPTSPFEPYALISPPL
jgi:hypothetical protein